MTSSKLHPLAVLGRADDPIGGLKGYCCTTFANLVALLGKPHEHDRDKITVLWAFRCADGTIFHVYDYKESFTPIGPYDWHVGGSSEKALTAFTRFTGLPTKPLDL